VGKRQIKSDVEHGVPPVGPSSPGLRFWRSAVATLVNHDALASKTPILRYEKSQTRTKHGSALQTPSWSFPWKRESRILGIKTR